MLRPWLVSAFCVAVVVAAILLWPEDAPVRKEAPRPRPPTPLDVKEVEIYLRVMPLVKDQLGRIAQEVMQIWEREGRYPDDPELNARAQSTISALLQQHHLTTESFDRLRKRVEYAVDVVRWESHAEERNAELDARIEEKQKLVEMAPDPALKRRLQEDLGALRAQRAAEGPPLSEGDRKLIRARLQELDRVVPGSDPKSAGRRTEPGSSGSPREPN